MIPSRFDVRNCFSVSFAGVGGGEAEETVDIVYNSATLMSKLLDDFLSLVRGELVRFSYRLSCM